MIEIRVICSGIKCKRVFEVVEVNRFSAGRIRGEADGAGWLVAKGRADYCPSGAVFRNTDGTLKSGYREEEGGRRWRVKKHRKGFTITLTAVA